MQSQAWPRGSLRGKEISPDVASLAGVGGARTSPQGELKPRDPLAGTHRNLESLSPPQRAQSCEAPFQTHMSSCHFVSMPCGPPVSVGM